MTNLSVRKLGDETVKRLRIRAAYNGVSMEEEIRRILSKAVSVPQRLGDFSLEYFGSKNGIDLELPEREGHEPLNVVE